MPGETHLWQAASAFAARAHAGQLRKDGRTPYVSHCFRVAMTVRDVYQCADEVAIAAALLHDTIEDTDTDYDDVHDSFGREIADCVAALTKNMILPESEREVEYDRRLADADWRARLIKLADVYDNLSELSRTTELGKMLDKCTRAVDLATPDAPSHDCTRIAIDKVRSLMAAAKR